MITKILYLKKLKIKNTEPDDDELAKNEKFYTAKLSTECLKIM